MEYLSRDKELQARLRRGINDNWTVVYHFFFDFDVSKDMRNNFEGFIRSLLYQLTKNLKAADLRGVEPEHGWSLRTLKERLTTIIEQRSNPICILLDGLDEYQGDKWVLASFLRETESPGVKFCFASRPDRVFNSIFQQLPTIKMQELNTPAIDKMVTLRIQRDMAISGFCKRKEVKQLANSIPEKAQGVFLWAHFAIEELRDGCSEGLDLKELRERLENLPEELEGIYARIFRKLRPEQRQQAAYMLQLVCYAKRTLTLRELYVATAHAASGRRPPIKHISAHDMEDFKRRIFAVTGGVLELFPTRESCKGKGLDYLELNVVWGSYRSQESDDFEMNEHRRDKMMFVNVIHRTVRTYLENKDSRDSSGWSQILGTAHEGSHHAQALWLRVCAAIFPPSFKELPPDDVQLSPTTSPGNYKRSGTTEKFMPLLEYAALFMLHHAADVEQGLDPDSYKILQPGISNSFLRFHQFYWETRILVCACWQAFPKPMHPLHLAIAHGLEGYVKDFLSTTCKNDRSGSREWYDIFYVETVGKYRYWRGKPPDSFRMSLLEFSIYYASHRRDRYFPQTRIVALLLEQYSHAHDAEMSVALQYSSAEVVKLLLRGWPDGKMILKSNLIESDLKTFKQFSRDILPEIWPDFSDVGPMWYIGSRCKHDRSEEEDDAELIDLFVRRGEDINAQCYPVGTALHATSLHLALNDPYPFMGRLLVAKGANVNASGPLGTPLEFVWRLVNTLQDDMWGFVRPYTSMIRWLIESGAVNNRCDPNGSIPSKERMLSFGAKEVWKSQALYRGDLTEDETSAIDKTGDA